MGMPRFKLSYSNVVSTLCLFLLLGGGAYAAVGGHSTRSVYACVEKRGGAVRLIGAASRCTRQERKTSWSRQGAVGPRGPAGAVGPAGRAFDAEASLPSGQTLSGPWALAVPGPSGSAQTQVQFAPRLPAPIPQSRVKFRFASGPFSAECPGVGRAAPGFFCIYENAAASMIYQQAVSVAGVETRGMTIVYNVGGANAAAYGSWAVTAP